MQTRSSDENSVSPSVRPSVKRVICYKTKERCVQIFIPYERSLSLVFREEELLVGVTPSTWNCWSTVLRWSEIADFEPIFAHSASAVTSSEKRSSINTNRKSTTRFPMSLGWSSYVIMKRLQWHKLRERVYREKIRTVEELQQRITKWWERLDQRVIDNAVKQWRKRLHACVTANSGHFNICCECHTTCSVNAEFYCHINSCPALK